MSFLGGLTPAGNYDRTAQQQGAPNPGSRQRSFGEFGEEAEVTRTRSTSITHSGREVEKDGNAESSNDTQVDEDSELERRESIVHSLARRYTTQSQANGGVNPFLEFNEDSPLNPSSPHFSARAWAKAFVNVASQTDHGFRTAGVAFQNLNVHGFGAATDYQKSVGNILFEASSLVRKITGHGKTKIDILRSFDGVVRKGEMLVVLGPPGSGCTTFLKTMAGETSGIYVDEKSHFNYQGENRIKLERPCHHTSGK